MKACTICDYTEQGLGRGTAQGSLCPSCKEGMMLPIRTEHNLNLDHELDTNKIEQPEGEIRDDWYEQD